MMKQELSDFTSPIRTKNPVRKRLSEPFIPSNCPIPLKSKPYKLLNDYLKLIKIGEGPFSQIKLMYNMKDQKYYAVKKYNMFVMKKKVKMMRDPETGKTRYGNHAEEVYQEIRVWSKASASRHVARLYEIIEDEQQEKIYLIMEYCSKGDIAKWNSKSKQFIHNWSIVELANLFYQTARGLADLHEINIVHRDIKPLNLLVTSQNQVRIIDFGLSVILSDASDKLAGTFGTYHFNAPQMLSEKQEGGYSGCKSDVWALGVSFFGILFGYLPFYDALQIKLFDLIEKGEYKFPDKIRIGYHPFIKLIQKMLDLQPSNRVSALQVCQEIKKIIQQLQNTYKQELQLQNSEIKK